MNFRVNLAYRAEQDIDQILRFLVVRSPQGAVTWADRWGEVLAELAESASQLPLAPENEDFSQEIRHVIFKTRRGKKYRALFVIEDSCVLVTHVRGPGQNKVSKFEPPNE